MNGRTFTLSRNSPLRTTLIDAATGRAVYEVDTPRTFSCSGATKIRKLDTASRTPFHSDDADYNSDEDTVVGMEEDELEPEFPETSNEIARIHWKLISSDRIIFRGKITTQNEFLPECGKMKGSYKFTGPNGVEYRWAMGAMGLNYPKLVTMDEKKTVIAKFHRAHHFVKKQNARLEVRPEGMEMLDHIVLTFVYAENKRRERERAVAASGS